MVHIHVCQVPGGGVLQYIDYTGICRSTGYGLQPFLSKSGCQK